MNSLLPSITGGIVRALIPFAAAKGIDLDNDQAEQLVQGGIELFTVLWSVFQKFSQHEKVEQAAADGR